MRKMAGMRNRLIHAYFDVDLDIVWTTVAEDLPPLLPAIESALTDLEASSGEPPAVMDSLSD